MFYNHNWCQEKSLEIIMSELEVLFEGNINVYLNGENALWVIDTNQTRNMDYYLGSPESKIKVTDFRYDSVNVAKQALQDEFMDSFADIFNQRANVIVRNRGDEVIVELHNPENETETRTLWLGVINDNRMPVHDVEWEIIHPISMSEVAFLVMIKPDNG